MRYAEDKFKELDADNRIWWGKDGNSIPQLKRFLSEVKQGVVPQTLWTYQEVGHTQEAKQELVRICDFEDSASVFITPKPVRLVRRILDVATDKDSLVLDSFAGTGTTGHALLAMNKADGGDRRFILVEMEEGIAKGVTAQRLTRVIEGHKDEQGLGGGFRYCRLGQPIFDEVGNIRGGVSFADLAAHVYFAETGEPMPKRSNGKSALLGLHNGRAVYLLFNGILGDRSPDGGNILTNAVLGMLAPHDGPRIIFGEGCRLGAARLKREKIVFKQIPYGIKVF